MIDHSDGCGPGKAQFALEKTRDGIKQICHQKRDQQRSDDELEFDQQCANDHNNGKRDNKFCVRTPRRGGWVLRLGHEDSSIFNIICSKG